MKVAEFLDLQAVDFSHKNASSIVDAHAGIDITESEEEMQPVMLVTDKVSNRTIKASNALLVSLLVNSKLFTVTSTSYAGYGINKNFRLKDKISIDLRNCETHAQRTTRLKTSSLREIFAELLVSNSEIEQYLFNSVLSGTLDANEILTEEGIGIFSEQLEKIAAERAEKERLAAYRAEQLLLAKPILELGFQYKDDGIFSLTAPVAEAVSLNEQARQFFDDTYTSIATITPDFASVILTVSGTVISKLASK